MNSNETSASDPTAYERLRSVLVLRETLLQQLKSNEYYLSQLTGLLGWNSKGSINMAYIHIEILDAIRSDAAVIKQGGSVVRHVYEKEGEPPYYKIPAKNSYETDHYPVSKVWFDHQVELINSNKPSIA